jgi:hypothetical protein
MQTLKDEIVHYSNFKIIQKNNNMYNPDENNVKYLVLLSCHCDSKLKLDTIKNNLKYFLFNCSNVVIINSEGLPLNNELKEYCSNFPRIKYHEIPNNNYIDFGKWIYAIENLIILENYDFIMFTNDSFIIHSRIHHFFNLAYKYNTDIYAYTSSSEIRLHYQSYLFQFC